jgi:RNA polymerase sigma-70 factor (ECF subfamily)
MDELTLLRSRRDDVAPPSREALNAGRAALLERASGAAAPAPAPTRRRLRFRRARWALAGVAAVVVGTLVAGNVTMNVATAHAAEVLRDAAVQAVGFTDPVPGSGQYLKSHTHAQWGYYDRNDAGELEFHPEYQTIDVYKPADRDAEWVLYRDWGDSFVPKTVNVVPSETGEQIEIERGKDGYFYEDDYPWVPFDFEAVPLDGAAAYAYIDSLYNGGSASRDENNFVRITDMLRTGLVPAGTRAALLDALSRIPGVTATENVANLDGVVGVAIGRTEPLRFGERKEIIIDPATGMVIGERSLATQAVFGWGVSDVITQTAIETTVTTDAP